MWSSPFYNKGKHKDGLKGHYLDLPADIVSLKLTFVVGNKLLASSVTDLTVYNAVNGDIPLFPGLFVEVIYNNSVIMKRGQEVRQERKTELCDFLTSFFRQRGLTFDDCASALGHMGKIPVRYSLLNESIDMNQIGIFERAQKHHHADQHEENLEKYFALRPEFQFRRKDAPLFEGPFSWRLGQTEQGKWTTYFWSIVISESKNQRQEGMLTLEYNQMAKRSRAERFNIYPSSSLPLPETSKITVAMSDGTKVHLQEATLSRTEDAQTPKWTLSNKTLSVSHSANGVTLTFSRHLDKAGFHREIITNLTLKSSASCKVMLVEALSELVFVDIYQVEEIQRFGGPQVLLYEEFDLEKPSSHPDATQNIVLVLSDFQERKG